MVDNFVSLLTATAHTPVAVAQPAEEEEEAFHANVTLRLHTVLPDGVALVPNWYDLKKSFVDIKKGISYEIH